jgi:hypothetical protein
MQILKIERLDVENLTVTINVRPVEKGGAQVAVTVEYDNPKARDRGEPPRLQMVVDSATDLSAMLGSASRQVVSAVAGYLGLVQAPSLRSPG